MDMCYSQDNQEVGDRRKHCGLATLH